MLRHLAASLALMLLPGRAGEAPFIPAEKPFHAVGKLVSGFGKSNDEMPGVGNRADVVFYVDGDRTRVEAVVSPGAPAAIEIADRKLGRKFIFPTRDGKAEEFPLTSETADPLEELAHFAKGKPKLVGPETAMSISCNKYEFTLANGLPAFLWVDAQVGVPVKMGDGKTFVLVFSSFKYGSQDKALFIPPAG